MTAAGGGGDGDPPDDDDDPNGDGGGDGSRLPPSFRPSKPRDNEGNGAKDGRDHLGREVSEVNEGAQRVNAPPTRFPSINPMYSERGITPARSTLLAPSGLLDVAGMAGLTFQDEDPLWQDFTAAQDAKKGYEMDDVTQDGSVTGDCSCSCRSCSGRDSTSWKVYSGTK